VLRHAYASARRVGRRYPSLDQAVRQLARARHVPDLVRRARHLQERRRFVRNEIDPESRQAAYHLRGGGLVAIIRHHTTDIAALSEFLVDRLYEIPSIVETRLRALGRQPEILDLGAHIGFFGLHVLTRFPTARVTAIEADPANVSVLRSCIAANRREHQWTVVAAAAGSGSGTIQFAGGLGMSSHVEPDGAPSDRSIRVPLVDALPFLLCADMTKMDIEGSEWALLEDDRFSADAVGPLVLEFHAQLCPEADPCNAAIRRLTSVGYHVHLVSYDSNRRIGMLWAWPRVWSGGDASPSD
jgi:FkbM family methyltransferase